VVRVELRKWERVHPGRHGGDQWVPLPSPGQQGFPMLDSRPPSFFLDASVTHMSAAVVRETTYVSTSLATEDSRNPTTR
jgi:hypothetical protein